MTKIIAIGGGEIGRPGFSIETTRIDKKIIKLSNKKGPRFIFIPTASSDSEGYVKTVKRHFGKRLNCRVDVLYLIKEKPSKKEIGEKILNSDIIYVGGGNTLKMMKIWRKYGVDKILKKAYKKGIILSGLSAGAICWFKFGHSDSIKFTDKKADYIKVSGLSLVNALFCPHYDVENSRQKSLKKMMKKIPGVAIAMENCSAIEIINNEYRIITLKSKAKAYKVYWKNGKYHKEIINQKKEFSPLKELLSK